MQTRPVRCMECKMYVNPLKFPAKTARIVANVRRWSYDLVCRG